MALQVLRPYIFLGISESEVNLNKIEASVASGKVLLFAGPYRHVLLAEDSSHIEPLMSLVTSLESFVTFREVYFGCEVRLREDFIGSKPMNLLIVPIGYETRVFVRAWGTSFLKVYRMLGEKWVLFYANPEDSEQRSIVNCVRKAAIREITGLSLHKVIAIPKPQRSNEKSDVLRATVREAKYQLQHAHMFIHNELARIRSQSKPKGPPISDQRSIFISFLLERELATLREAKLELGTSVTSIQKAVSVLNEFESVKNIVERTKEDSEMPMHFRNQLLRSREIFRVEDAFVLEAHKTLKLAGSAPLVIQGVGYYVGLREVFGERLIELPITLGLRLGLLPILFRVIAHFFVEERRRQLESCRKELKEELSHRSGVSTLHHVVSDSRRWDSLTNVLLGDMIAAELGGPAYFYALCRGFAYDLEGSKDACLRIQDRLRLLHLCLSAKGFQIPPFASQYEALKRTDDIDGQKLNEMISTACALTGYSTETHESVTEEVKNALLQGKVVAAKPSTVTNALWKAVLEKKGYLNENAAFLSILEWTESLASHNI